MQVRIFSVAIAAASMAMVSCDKNDTTVINGDEAVRFSSGITATPPPVSRVGIDNEGNSEWDKGDAVGIYMVNNGTTDVVDAAANVKYTADKAGTSTMFAASAAAIYYPLDKTVRVDFIAYHPYNAALTGFDYPVALSVQTPQTAIDLMTAKADKSGTGYSKDDGRTNTVVNFAFSHQLVKLVMNVTKDASVPGAITSATINGMNTAATFDLKGVRGFTAPGTPAAITPFTVTAGSKYEAILLPVDELTDSHTVTFTTDNGETYEWVMNNQITNLESGKIYKYDITVTKYAVTANGTINAWKVGSTGTGTAE